MRGSFFRHENVISPKEGQTIPLRFFPFPVNNGWHPFKTVILSAVPIHTHTHPSHSTPPPPPPLPPLLNGLGLLPYVVVFFVLPLTTLIQFSLVYVGRILTFSRKHFSVCVYAGNTGHTHTHKQAYAHKHPLTKAVSGGRKL